MVEAFIDDVEERVICSISYQDIQKPQSGSCMFASPDSKENPLFHFQKKGEKKKKNRKQRLQHLEHREAGSKCEFSKALVAS